MRFRPAPLAALCLLAGSAIASDPPSERAIHFTYTATAPVELEDGKSAELWLPLPLESADQSVRNLEIDSPLPYEILEESRFGNRMVRVTGPAEELAGAPVTISFDVTRRAIRDRSRDEAVPTDGAFLGPDDLVPIDGPIAERAQKSAGERTDPMQVARALYDDVVMNLDYDKSGEGWGRGDALYACSVEKGNCTDFHSLFIGMCRARGIPARFTMGVPLPADQAEGTVPGYHCWAEFYIEGQGWVPVDASEASKHPEKAEFLFGNLDPDRVEFCRGRDIVLPGREDQDPLNYFIYPFATADGVPVEGARHEFAFRPADS